MASSSVRVEEKTIEKLRVISKEENRPIGQIVTDLVDKYEKDRFWEQAREDFARLREDPVAWKEYQEEADLWQRAAADNLRDEPPYYTSEELAEMDAEDA